MADLGYSRNVPATGQGEQLPKPVQRSVKVDVIASPDFQTALTNYADATNWMSSIGSAIATRASNAVASELGQQMGQNPKGNIGIPFTEFDKALQQSYQTQAQATLGLQANRLITEANLEVARSPRVTPDLIASTNNQVTLGLKNIFANAPSEVRANLAYHYGNVQISQNADLTQRMIREQRDDQKNRTAMSSQQNAEDAYSFGLNGNDKAALNAIEITRRLNETDVGARLSDPVTARSRTDTVRKSYLTGKKIREYNEAVSNGKGAEYLRSIAEKKPSDLSDADYLPVTNNLLQYVNHQNSLRNQDEQLRLSRFSVEVAKNPMNPALPAQLQELQDNVSPLAFEKAQLHLVNAIKRMNKDNLEQNTLLSSWGDSAAHARTPEKVVNQTFDMLVQKEVDKGTSREDAEVQIANSSGAPVPVFVKTLNNKLTSANPVQIASAAMQVQRLRDMEGDHAITGLSKNAQAIAIQFQHQRGSMSDSDLARKLTDNILPIDESMQKTLDNAWNTKLASKNSGFMSAKKSLYEFALGETDLGRKDFGGGYFKVIYGNDIYEQMRSNFDSARGDYDTALQMTKDYVKQNYGETGVNGGTQFTDRPIEKFLGYSNSQVVPFIQQDILNQMSVQFEKHKGEKNDYWTAGEIKTERGNSLLSMISEKHAPAEVIRHVKTASGEKMFRYPVSIVGRPGGEWDIVLKTPTGPRNIFLIAPSLEIMTYKPDAESIRKNYESSLQQKKGLFNVR